jgi:hypothetical protein
MLTLESFSNLVWVEFFGVLVASLDCADFHRVPGLLGNLDAWEIRETQGVIVDFLEVRLQQRNVNHLSQTMQ